MAAPRAGGGDRREMSQAAHLQPWLERVDNRAVGFPSQAMGKELTAMKGGRVVEPQTFELQDIHISATNPKITEMNTSIVKKMNALSVQRCDHFNVIGVGSKASVAEKNLVVKNIRNLLTQINRFQATVADLGGVPFPTPKEFDDVKDLK